MPHRAGCPSPGRGMAAAAAESATAPGLPFCDPNLLRLSYSFFMAASVRSKLRAGGKVARAFFASCASLLRKHGCLSAGCTMKLTFALALNAVESTGPVRAGSWAMRERARASSRSFSRPAPSPSSLRTAHPLTSTGGASPLLGGMAEVARWGQGEKADAVVQWDTESVN